MHSLIIFFPSDPFGERVGGINSYIKSLIQHTPNDFVIEWIGITSDVQSRPPLQSQPLEIDGRAFIFTPVLHENDQNIRRVIPLSLRYGLAIAKLKRQWDNHLLFFHRIEPVIFFKKKAGIKIVLVHNDIKEQIYAARSEVIWSKIPRLYRIFEDYVIPQFTRVYSVSEHTVDYYQQRYPMDAKKYAFLPTWVDPTIFGPRTTDRHHYRSAIYTQFQAQMTQHMLVATEPWFLFVGRLQPQKDPFLLISSFEAYYLKHKKGYLFLIGDGNLKNELQQNIAEKHLMDRVLLLGSQNRATLKQFYHASDTLMLTSCFEGMPISVLESLASGLPVLTPRVGEVARVVKNGLSGEIIENRCADEIVIGMEKLIDNHSVYTQAHCVDAIQPYTPEQVATPLFDNFRNLLDEHNQ